MAPIDPSPSGRGPATTAHIIRANDMMRSGSDALLTDISPGFLHLRVQKEFSPNEQLKIRLENLVQKCEKDLRGVVRKTQRLVDGGISVEVELFTRLTPLEVSMLKMGIPAPGDDSAPRWV